MMRAHELGTATAVPEGFQLVHFVHVSNRNEAEKQVHAMLHPYRKTSSKEFFSAPVAQAVEVLDRVAEEYPIVVGRGAWCLGAASVL